ncbi:MAG: GHKL domain-containing protein, partial [Leptospiraceae bacterium]|nr:GHKL domain-containing protein [Leptospiraceae bacterium]
AYINFFYVTVSSITLFHLFKTKSIIILKYSQLILILFIPFIKMWLLGGIISGSFAFIWAFFTPILASIVLPKDKRRIWYFSLFVLIVFSEIIDSHINSLIKPFPEQLLKIFYFLNTSLVFIGIYVIIKKYRDARDLILKKNQEKTQRNEAIMVKAFHQLREKENKLTELNSELKSTIEQLHNQKSELEKALKELKEAQGLLVHSEKMASIGTLTAGVAHELNNPLNFIQAGLEALTRFLEKTLGKELSNFQPFFKVMQEGVDRATGIVKALNQFSRSQDRMDEKFDVKEVIENCLTMLASQIKTNIQLNKLFIDKEALILGNSGKIHQVFLNIITNAIQAIQDTGNIEIVIEKSLGNIIIRIKDSGIGIPEENFSKLGTPFFTTKDIGQGTGLGLSISYKIIEDHKGRITVNSEIEKGTEFIVTIPELPND